MIGRIVMSAGLCAVLAACSGGSGTTPATTSPSPSSPTPTSPSSPASMLSTPAAPATFIAGNYFSTARLVEDSSTGHVTVEGALLNFNGSDGTTGFLTLGNGQSDPFTWNARKDAYVSNGGYTIHIYDTPNAPGVYTVQLDYTGTAPLTGYASIADSYAPLSLITANTGSASYTGDAVATDNRGNTVNGSVSMKVVFGNTPTVSGSITLDKGSVVGPATFNLGTTPIVETGVNGASVAGFYDNPTHLTSKDVTVNGSGIEGAFSGNSGQNLAGTFSVDTNKGNVAGAYAAVKQ